MSESPENKPDPQAPDPEPAEQALEKKTARIISDRPRRKAIKLDWPVEFDGKIYESVDIKRCSGAEVDDFLERIRNGEGAGMPPMIDCPIEVWDAMDDDDRFKVDKEGWVFFPLRLREFMPSNPGQSDDTSDM